ncbi:MAG: glycosyltransferase family 2 protein [Caldanaerobacter sp.]
MAEQKVSVVIPCYNSQSTISKVIVGLLSQTVKPLEIILVNDASTDETVKVVEKYDIKVINNPVNIGPAASRNRGFLECQGDIILFIDSNY